MTIVYLIWHDAHFELNEARIDQLGTSPCELHEVGFLYAETADTVSIATEYMDGAETVRGALTIPRVNIVEMRKMPLDKAFPKRKRK